MNSWILGYTIGAAVVLVVVAVLLLMIRGARRAAEKVEAVAAELVVARDRTAALRQLDRTSDLTQRVVDGCAAARAALTRGATP
jgi:predicted LPLAT superfamily acyltransferase